MGIIVGYILNTLVIGAVLLGGLMLHLPSRVLEGLQLYAVPRHEDEENFKEAQGGGKKAGTTRRRKGGAGLGKAVKEEGGTIHVTGIQAWVVEEGHFFREYQETFLWTLMATACLLLHEALSNHDALTGLGTALIIGLVAVVNVLRQLFVVQFDPETTPRVERWFSLTLGILASLVALSLLTLPPTTLLDFNIRPAAQETYHVFINWLEHSKLNTTLGPIRQPIKQSSSTHNSTLNLAVNTTTLNPADNSTLNPALIPDAIFNATLNNPSLDASTFDSEPFAALDPAVVAARSLVLYQCVVLLLTLTAGVVTGITVPAAFRAARCFHMESSSLSRLHNLNLRQPCWAQALLAAGLAVPLVAALMWLQPIAEDILVWEPREGAPRTLEELPRTESGLIQGKAYADFIERGEDWSHGLGMSRSSFHTLRLVLLLAAGVIRVLALRVNVQAYLCTAAVIWYETLHSDPKGSVRQELLWLRVVRNNYFLCKVALQQVAPGMLTLLFVGLARTRGPHLDIFAASGSSPYVVAPSLVRASMIFLAWWTCASWAALTLPAVALLRYRAINSH